MKHSKNLKDCVKKDNLSLTIMKTTAVSPSNIAFIKYWGKKDSKLNIPYNDSISMNLDSCLTKTSTEFNPSLKADKVFIGGKEVLGEKKDRVTNILNIVRKKAGIKTFAKVETENNFPSDAGIASSASGFSALALSASRAASLNLSEKELSVLARMGSGSACRSIPDGFTYWKKGKSGDTSYAFQIAKPGFWDLRDIIAVTSLTGKKTSSTEGHSLVKTSPYFEKRIKGIEKRTLSLKKALLKRDFKTFGELLEEEAVDLHVMAMTSHPAVFYWNSGTMSVMHKIFELREKGVSCYFTMDAGPNVHVICEGKNEKRIKKEIEKLPEVEKVIVNKPGKGARIV